MSKFELSPIVTEFKKQHSANVKKECSLIAGVSGGPDSMALLYLLHRFDANCTVVHCNYGLRGEASDKDQELVEKMSGLWGFDCVSVRLEQDDGSEGNFQQWARNRRYQVFYDLMREVKADYIATAHHKDDQVETILQKILRGSGMSSWKGMSVLEDNLYRPLLNISKKEILSFVQKFNVPFRMDGSNEESTYARNFLRHSWVPQLEKLFPGWDSNILKLPARAEEFKKMVDYILNDVAVEGEALNFKKFSDLDAVLQPVILHSFITKLDPEANISSRFLRNISDLSNLQTGGEVRVTDEITLKRDREFLILAGRHRQANSFESIVINELDHSFEFAGFSFSRNQKPTNFNPSELSLDLGKLTFPIKIRLWEKGDEIQPLGMKGTQQVADHLTNRKISSIEKKQALVLQSFDGTIHAVIFPHELENSQIGTISEKAKCDDSTETTLCIRKN